MAYINWGELGKQLIDWGGDYDIFGNASFDGGARDAAPRNLDWRSPNYGSTQGKTKPGYDSTGRLSTANTEEQTQEDKNIVQQPPASNNNGNGGFGAAPKVLDTEQLASLDELLRDLDVVRRQAKEKARMRRDEAKRTKEEERDREKGKYEGKKVSTYQDFAGAKTDTDLNVRDTLENLVSSLSTLGLGGSRALTRQILSAANKSNRKANTTQAQNTQGLDSAWNEFSAGNSDDLKKIEDQYGYDVGEADRVWGQNRQNYLNKKADVYNAADRSAERAQLMQEARDMGGFITKAPFMNPSYTGKSRAMETPELADYQQDIAKYDTSAVGADATGLTPVAAGVTPGTMPGNLAVKAIAVNDEDLGVKKKLEGVDPILGV